MVTGDEKHKTLSASVVIPVYNGCKFVARAIQSVLAQTRPADEIIVIDDGSTDNTVDIVHTFGSKVRLITQSNSGVSVARNTGIAAATSDWIAFLDADDEWLPDKLHCQEQFLKQHRQVEWAYTNFKPSVAHRPAVHPDLPDNERRLQVFDDYLNAYCSGFYAWTGTVIIHRSVFDTVGFFEPGMKRAQDNDLWFRIAYQFPQVGYVPQPLAVYHLDTPDSSTKINDSVDYMIDLVERHRTLSRKFNRADAFRPCIMHMLQVWIRQLEKQKRSQDAFILLDRYGSFLSKRFRREMHFRLSVPWVGSAITEAYSFLKKRWRIVK